MCVARLENEGKYAMDLVDATATKVHLIPVCKGLVTHLFGILENTLLIVMVDILTMDKLRRGTQVFEIMPLPPVEEVGGGERARDREIERARDGKRNEKKSGLRRFGGTKKEWWVENMKKGEMRKKRFVSSEGVVRMLVVEDVDQGDVEEGKKIQNGNEEGICKNWKKDERKVEGMKDTTQEEKHKQTTRNHDDQLLELKIEELDSIERNHVKLDASANTRPAQPNNPASGQTNQMTKEDKIQTKSIRTIGDADHERRKSVQSRCPGQEEVAPPHHLKAYLLCIFLSLALLALVVSSVLVAPLGSWLQVEGEEEACPCSCTSY